MFLKKNRVTLHLLGFAVLDPAGFAEEDNFAHYGINNMATTIQIWKEIFTHRASGFNPFGIFNTKYEVLFKRKLSDDLVTVWFNAYVKLTEPLEESYVHESYRNKNIIGVDSSDSTSMSEDLQKELVRERIKSIIEEHHAKY